MSVRARSLSDAALGYPRGAMGGFLGFVFLHNTICHNRECVKLLAGG